MDRSAPHECTTARAPMRKAGQPTSIMHSIAWLVGWLWRLAGSQADTRGARRDAIPPGRGRREPSRLPKKESRWAIARDRSTDSTHAARAPIRRTAQQPSTASALLAQSVPRRAQLRCARSTNPSRNHGRPPQQPMASRLCCDEPKRMPCRRAQACDLLRRPCLLLGREEALRAAGQCASFPVAATRPSDADLSRVSRSNT